MRIPQAGDTFALLVTDDSTVEDLKKIVKRKFGREFKRHRTDLGSLSPIDGSVILLPDQRGSTLAASGIGSGTMLTAMVKDGFNGGARRFTFRVEGLFNSGRRHLGVSSDNEQLYVSNASLNHITTFSLPDLSSCSGSIRELADVEHSVYSIHEPRCIEIWRPQYGHGLGQHDRLVVLGKMLLPASGHRQQCVVVMTCSGSPLRFISSPGNGNEQFVFAHCISVCPNADINMVAIMSLRSETDFSQCKVLLNNLETGIHMRSIVIRDAKINRIYLEPTGQYLFSIDSDAGVLHQRRLAASNDYLNCAAAGSVIETIGSPGNGEAQLSNPTSACVSPDGRFLLIADNGNRRVQVRSQSDGEFLSNIPIQPNWLGNYPSCATESIQQIVITPDGDSILLLHGSLVHVLDA